MNPNPEAYDVDSRLQRVTQATNHGQRQIALELVREILAEEPENERALLLAADLAPTPQEGITYLEQAVAVNPSSPSIVNSLAIRRMSLEAEREQEAGASDIRITSWHCPLCNSVVHSTENTRCSRCNSILAVENLQIVAANRGVNEAAVEVALVRWLGIAERDPSGEAYLNVARAYLNLHRSAEAAPYLRKACRWAKDAAALKLAADVIERRKLIVAADDSKTFRKILQIIIDRAGYRIVTASDGMEALTAVATWAPSLVLLDINMPKMNGYQVCKAIRNSTHAAKVPVVFLSGNDGFFDHLKGAMSGAEDYISKPIDEKELLRAIAKHLPPSEGG